MSPGGLEKEIGSGSSVGSRESKALVWWSGFLIGAGRRCHPSPVRKMGSSLGPRMTEDSFLDHLKN